MRRVAALLLLLALPSVLRAQTDAAAKGAGTTRDHAREVATVHPESPSAGLDPATPEDAQDKPAEAQEPQRTDLFDLLKKLRRRQPPSGPEAPPAEPDAALDLTLVPVIAANPSAGFSVGAGASLEFPLGDLRRTRVSQFNVSAVVTTRKQVRTSATARLYGADNRWYVDGDDHYMLTANDTYALGTSAQGAPVRADYHSTRFFNTFYWRLGKGFYGGVGLNYARQANIHPASGEQEAWDDSPLVTYSRRHGFDLDAQTAAGPTVGAFFDNRDSGIDAVKGWYAGSIYRTYVKGLAGGSSTWQELYLDLRTYKRLTKSRTQRLAFWTYGDLVTGGTAPYLSLPSTGGDAQGRSGRGYADGRFRGERLLYGEVEYRTTLTRNGLVGAVVFANATTVSNRGTGERLFDAVAPGGGLGLRFLLQKRSRTNLCFDYGWGRGGDRGIYVGLGEAF